MLSQIMNKSIIALIPARCGSSRIPDKNIKPLNGQPLIFHTIEQAKQRERLPNESTTPT